MKKILAILFVLAANLSFAAEDSKAPSYGAAIYVSGEVPLKPISAKKSGTVATPATWKKESKETGVSAVKSLSGDRWEKMEFAFISEKDGTVAISLRAKFLRDKNGDTPKYRVLFDSVCVNGDLMPNGNFEDGRKGWESSTPSNKFQYILKANVFAHEGKACAVTTYSNTLSQNIDVKAGQKYEVSAMVRFGGFPNEHGSVDLKKIANIGFVDSRDDSDGDYVSLKNLKDYKLKVDDLNFDLIDPSTNNGKSSALFSSNRTVETSVPVDVALQTPIRGAYLYLIHSIGAKFTKEDLKNIGAVTVEYADGRKVIIQIKKDSDASSMYKETPRENALPVYVDDKEKKSGVLYMSRYPLLRDVAVTKLTISSFNAVSWNVAAISISSKRVETSPMFELKKDEWKAIDISDLEVKDGSALDVSAGMTEKPAGKYGKLAISNEGRYIFEDLPNVPVKIKGTNWRPGNSFFTKWQTHEDIDEIVKIIRKQGYNLVRWRISMMKEKEFEAPYKMRPEVQDMYDYFIFALAREGVYSHWNLASHDLGDPNFSYAIDRYDTKLKLLLGDKEMRKQWETFVRWQLNHVNKYTGKKWKDDPSIATTEYFNEIELGVTNDRLITKVGRDFANGKFREWLKAKYNNDIENLKKQWEKDGVKKHKYSRYKDFSDVVVFGEYQYKWTPDLLRFIVENGREFQKFAEGVFRSEGYMRPIHQHNCARPLAFYFLSAEAGSYQALNVYFTHPSSFNDLDSFAAQTSSFVEYSPITSGRGAASKRIADRPMALTDWQHCHWNPFKHEAGVVFPSYSALQDFQNLTVHDVAIEKNGGKSIFGHAEVGRNPIARANEFLSYCMFYRGDVKKSPHRVEIVFEEKYIKENPMISNTVSQEQSKIAFMTGFSIAFPSARVIDELKNVKIKEADIKLQPVGAASTSSHDQFSETGATVGEKFDLDAFVLKLREMKILPKDNISDPKNGVYQSDTGEITLRTKEELAKVVTPNTEALALKAKTKNEKLGRLTVKSTSVPASVAVTSVDGKPLAQSKRMVFIYATDTIATDAKLSQDRTRMLGRGKQPILVQGGKLSAELALPKSAEGKSYSFYALKLTGERVEKVPMEIKDGKMLINLDTLKLEKEPAVFYEIVEE